ncbi:MAG: Gfo/Idh/MocA family oxidoreductase [Thermoguttaceae bacterium]
MKNLRIAVVGAGRLGGFHAQKLAARKDVELLAIVDPLAANRERVAAECHTAARADCADLLGQLDAAVIAAPTTLHHHIARRLLDAGVHLLVEKPLCSTQSEADELVAIAKRHGATLQVGHVERFNPAFHAAADALRAPKYIEATRTSGFTFRSTDVGVVLDVMIHDIDLVLSMVRSPVRKVEALGFSVLGGHEDVANARIEFESGCVASLSASRVSYEQIRRMQVWSADGFAAVDFAARTTTLVRPSETLRRRAFDVAALLPAQVDYFRQHFAEEHLPKETRTFDAVDALALEQDDFIESIRGARQPRVTGEAGRDALAVAEQILARINGHCWDATLDGPTGPLGLHRPHVIPSPHFTRAAATAPALRERAS